MTVGTFTKTLNTLTRLRLSAPALSTMHAFVPGLPLGPAVRSFGADGAISSRTPFTSGASFVLRSSAPRSQVPAAGISMTIGRMRRHRRWPNDLFWGPSPDRALSRLFEPWERLLTWPMDDAAAEETDSEYIFKMILPGVKRQEIKVDVQDNVLTVRVDRQEEIKEEKNQVEWVQKQMQNFVRSWRMPENADLKNIKAITKDGILTVTVPKLSTPEAEKVVIDVQGED